MGNDVVFNHVCVDLSGSPIVHMSEWISVCQELLATIEMKTMMFAMRME